MGNRTSVILCVVGGILLILQGVSGSIGFLENLNRVEAIPELQELMWIIQIVLYVTLILAELGGFSVIGGAFLLSKDRIGTGKFVIGLGAGMSLIGVIIGLIQPLMSTGLEGAFNALLLITQMQGWVGIILTIIGRQLAGKSE